MFANLRMIVNPPGNVGALCRRIDWINHKRRCLRRSAFHLDVTVAYTKYWRAGTTGRPFPRVSRFPGLAVNGSHPKLTFSCLQSESLTRFHIETAEYHLIRSNQRRFSTVDWNSGAR